MMKNKRSTHKTKRGRRTTQTRFLRANGASPRRQLPHVERADSLVCRCKLLCLLHKPPMRPPPPPGGATAAAAPAAAPLTKNQKKKRRQALGRLARRLREVRVWVVDAGERRKRGESGAEMRPPPRLQRPFLHTARLDRRPRHRARRAHARPGRLGRPPAPLTRGCGRGSLGRGAPRYRLGTGGRHRVRRSLPFLRHRRRVRRVRGDGAADRVGRDDGDGGTAGGGRAVR